MKNQVDFTEKVLEMDPGCEVAHPALMAPIEKSNPQASVLLHVDEYPHSVCYTKANHADNIATHAWC